MPELGDGCFDIAFDPVPGPSVAIAPPGPPDLLFVPQTGPAGKDGSAALPDVIDLGGPNQTNGA